MRPANDLNCLLAALESVQFTATATDKSLRKTSTNGSKQKKLKETVYTIASEKFGIQSGRMVESARTGGIDILSTSGLAKAQNSIVLLLSIRCLSK